MSAPAGAPEATSGPTVPSGGTAPSGTTTVRGRREIAVLLVTALLAVVALLWVTDRAARTAAEALVTSEIHRLTGTPLPPEVDLGGGSFLLQALRGRYGSVQVSTGGLTNGPLVVSRLDAELTGVRLPLAELVRRNPSVLGVERATGTALLSWVALEEYLSFTGRPYTVGPGQEPGEIALRGRVQVFEEGYDVAADAVLGARGGELTVTPVRLSTGTDLDGPVELLIDQRFTFVVPLDPLPFGQEVVDVRATPEGVVVRTEASALELRPR